ncbi:MAG: efflux RND transporter periplasmic adaptor subunit, partial [Rhodanobacteraceae bacterium]
MSRFLVPVALTLALVACGGGGQDADKDADANSRVPVEVAAAAHAPINASYSGTAALEAQREADVVAKTSGVLLKLYV